MQAPESRDAHSYRSAAAAASSLIERGRPRQRGRRRLPRRQAAGRVRDDRTKIAPSRVRSSDEVEPRAGSKPRAVNGYGPATPESTTGGRDQFELHSRRRRRCRRQGALRRVCRRQCDGVCQHRPVADQWAKRGSGRRYYPSARHGRPGPVRVSTAEQSSPAPVGILDDHRPSIHTLLLSAELVNSPPSPPTFNTTDSSCATGRQPPPFSLSFSRAHPPHQPPTYSLLASRPADHIGKPLKTCAKWRGKSVINSRVVVDGHTAAIVHARALSPTHTAIQPR